MKKLLTLMVACLVLTAISVRPVAASANAEKEARFAGKVKSGIESSARGAIRALKLNCGTRRASKALSAKSATTILW
jgi:hypothetical protein